jgi:hypothetical protein
MNGSSKGIKLKVTDVPFLDASYLLATHTLAKFTKYGTGILLHGGYVNVYR